MCDDGRSLYGPEGILGENEYREGATDKSEGIDKGWINI